MEGIEDAYLPIDLDCFKGQSICIAMKVASDAKKLPVKPIMKKLCYRIEVAELLEGLLSINKGRISKSYWPLEEVTYKKSLAVTRLNTPLEKEGSWNKV